MAKRPATANVQLKLRCKELLRARLEKSARRRDVSLNEEMITRLESSFESERIFGVGDTRKIVETMARMIEWVEESTGKSCTKDLETRRRVKEIMGQFFDVAVGAEYPWHDETAKNAAGKAIARSVLKGLCKMPETRIAEAFKVLEETK